LLLHLIEHQCIRSAAVVPLGVQSGRHVLDAIGLVCTFAPKNEGFKQVNMRTKNAA
jgi:hypothetical protein